MVFEEYLKDEMEVDRAFGADQDEDEMRQGLIDQRNQDDFDLYNDFILWIEEKLGGSDLVPKIGDAAYIQAISCQFWLNGKGKIESSPREAAEGWQILWDMWQKELE